MILINRGCVMIDYLDNLGRKDSYKARYEALVKAIDEAPVVDAEPVVYGRWEDEDSGKLLNPHYRCSVCKERALKKYELTDSHDLKAVQALTQFCPYCGAKMERE